MSNFEINDLGKFLNEKSEEIIELNDEETSVEEENVDEEDKLVPKSDDDRYDDDEIQGEDTNEMPEDLEAFCLQMMRMYVNVHLWHLQTGSHAEHEALEDYYEDLFELTDTFIETAIANTGSISCDTSYNLEVLPYCDMIDEIEAFKELTESQSSKCDEDSMVNILDDVLTITDEVLYKIKNLK